MSEAGNSKRAAVIAALLLFGSAGAWLALAPQPQKTAEGIQFRKETIDLVTAGGVRKLHVELAVTPAELAYGLMFRTSLADDHGMLFLYSETREVRMWMRNTYIPLDMVFIRPDGTVLRVEPNTEPLSERIIESGGSVSAVLEMAGGATQRIGLKPGDKIIHPHFAPEKR